MAMLFVAVAVSACATSHPADIKKSEEPQIKTIGIIGGISWQSSIEYYRLINEMVGKELGGLHSAKILMYSIEFGEFSNRSSLQYYELDC